MLLTENYTSNFLDDVSLNTVEFTHNYSLAKSSKDSYGKLSLTQVKDFVNDITERYMSHIRDKRHSKKFIYTL